MRCCLVLLTQCIYIIMMRVRLHLGGQCGYGTVASYHRNSDAGSEKGNCEPLLRTAVSDLADGQHCNGKYVSRYLDI